MNVSITFTDVTDTAGACTVPVSRDGRWAFVTRCLTDTKCSATAKVTTQLQKVVNGIRQVGPVQIDPRTYTIAAGKSKTVHMRFDKRGRRLLLTNGSVLGKLIIAARYPHHHKMVGRQAVSFSLS